MDKQKVLTIKTGDAIKSIADLKNNIAALKKQLTDTDKTFEDNQKTIKSLRENQAALRDAMYATGQSIDDVTEAAKENGVVFDEDNKIVKSADVSYNTLVNTLASLKSVWRATTDEAEREVLGKRINSLNQQLKDMDASVGVFGRNVGNYVGALDQFAQGFGSMGRGAQGVIAPIKGVTMGLKTLSTTPVIAILGVLVNILSKVIEELKSSEENTQAMTAALAPFNAVLDVAQKALQAVGKVVAVVVEGFSRLTKAIFGTNEATQKRIELAQKEQQLAKQQRQTLIANAEAERDVAELRAKASDREQYTAEQRLAYLQRAGELEKEIAQRALADAKLQYEAIKLKNSMTQSSKEELDKEAQAYAAMVKAETDYYNAVRTINMSVIRTRKEIAKEEKEMQQAKLQAEKDLIDSEIELTEQGSEQRLALVKQSLLREYRMQVENARQKITDKKILNATLLNLEKKYQRDVAKAEQENREESKNLEVIKMQNRLALMKEGSREYLVQLEKIAKAEYESIEQGAGESMAKFNQRRLAQAKVWREAREAIRKWDAEAASHELRLAALTATQSKENILAMNAALTQAQVSAIEAQKNTTKLTKEQYEIQLAEAKNAAKAAMNELLNYQNEQDILRKQNEVDSLREGSFQRLAAEIELKKYELDTLQQLEEESDADFQARKLAKQKEYQDAERAIWAQGLSVFQEYASGIGNLLGSIADLYESNTNMTEAEAKKAKNLRIAGAYIEMLNGVVTAISVAQELGPIAGPIMAGINSAAVIASGMANINKIKSTSINKNTTPAVEGESAAATPVAVEAPTLTPVVNNVRNITGASEEQRLNRMADSQRVYILSSDLEADASARRVRTSETTF